MRQVVAVLVTTLCLLARVACQECNNSEREARQFLADFNLAVTERFNRAALKSWALNTNITDFNQEQLIIEMATAASFQRDMRARALRFNNSAMSYDTRRQLGKITSIGTAAQPDEVKVQEISKVLSDMGSIYSKAKVCLTPEHCFPSETEMTATFRDYDKLLQIWVGWRNETGRKLKNLYTRFVELSNEAVSFLGYKDTGAEWRSYYESDSFVEDVRALYDQVRPLYQQLHAYVRRGLKKVYGEDRFPSSGHIPAHILGDMWALQWSSIYGLLVPFRDRPSIDVTEEMIRQNYTVLKIFRTAEDFFTSLGFDEMVPSFWTRSMLEKPSDGREVVCNPSAWDFGDQKDFRVKMCTVVTQLDFMIAHHEMGHIVYFMAYKDQPFVYRDGANDGFHEAVGDVMTLSFQTPEHLFKLGLIKEVPTDKESDINFLMNMALQKVAFLPFGYLVDLWRWSVFSGETTPDNYNREWWHLRCELQGVFPPVPRSEEDFDPGAMFHIPTNVPYLRYFLSFIFQFQFHKAACDAAGYTGPIHRCDIYNTTAAGEKLGKMLELGSSRPWPVAMRLITGQDKMDAGPLLEYFQPLYQFLLKENGHDFGWSPECPQ